MITVPVILDATFQINLNGSSACNLSARPISISRLQEKMFEAIANNVVKGHRDQIFNQASMKAKCGYYVGPNRRCRYGGVIEIDSDSVDSEGLKNLQRTIDQTLDALGEVEPLFTEIASKDGQVPGKILVEHGKFRPSKKIFYIEDSTLFNLIKDIRDLATINPSKLKYLDNDDINRTLDIPPQSGSAQLEQTEEVLTFEMTGAKFSDYVAYVKDDSKKKSTKELSYNSKHSGEVYQCVDPAKTGSVVSAKVKRLTVYKNGIQETKSYQLIEIIERLENLDMFSSE